MADGTLWWLLGALIAALAVADAALYRQLRRTRAALAELSAQFTALQQQSQRDLLAMGQRVMEVDKVVRRFSERLDALHSEQPAAARYGQLEALLESAARREENEGVSAAEAALLSLLQRNSSGG